MFLHPYFSLILIDFGIQWLGWALAYALRTEKFYDATGKEHN